MEKQVIKINESQLRRMIKEAVEKVISENKIYNVNPESVLSTFEDKDEKTLEKMGLKPYPGSLPPEQSLSRVDVLRQNPKYSNCFIHCVSGTGTNWNGAYASAKSEANENGFKSILNTYSRNVNNQVEVYLIYVGLPK